MTIGLPRGSSLVVAAPRPDQQDLLRSRFQQSLRESGICAAEEYPRTSKPPLACRWLMRRASSLGLRPPLRSLAVMLPQGCSDAKRGRTATRLTLVASANGRAGGHAFLRSNRAARVTLDSGSES